MAIQNEAHSAFDAVSGSRFERTGQLEDGPSPRSLDRLPSELSGGILRVTNQIIYGDSAS